MFERILVSTIEGPDVEVNQDQLESVKTFGLFHPITVQEVAGVGYKLRAGKQRLAIAKALNWTHIDAKICDASMTNEQLEEISLQENLKRQNLPWWQVVLLEAELHNLRQKQHGAAKPGRAKGGWSLRDTAEEMGMGFGNLSEDLRLAEAVMADPSLRRIEDKTTAKRIIFSMAKRIEAENEAGLPIAIEYNVALHGDSAEILSHYPEATFNVCITDPPWLEYKDAALTKDDRTLPVFKELYRVLKRDAFLYAFVSTPDWIFYERELRTLGFKVMGMPLIWQKLAHISKGVRTWEYMRDYEPILLAVKGTPTVTWKTAPSAIFSYPIIHNSRQIHPNEKPIELIKQIIDQCSYEGSLIVDPFGGSGVVAEAAKETQRRYVTIERNRQFYEGIERRLSGDKGTAA